MSVTKLWSLLKQTFSAWNEDEAPQLGAALAFYTILSLAPLLILVVAIVGLAFGSKAAEMQVVNQFSDMIGQEAAKEIETVIASAQKPASGIFATILGTLTLLFGASGVFGELRSTLNKIWHSKPANESGWSGMLRERLLSFGMVLAIGFLLLVSLAISAFMAIAGKFFGGLLPLPEVVLTAINFLVSFGTITVLFALIYRFVPAIRIPWRPIWVGAILTAFFFTVGKTLIGLYLGKAAVGSAYGAAGSVIVIIVWVYYSAQILFFGAEFTRVYAGKLNAR